MRRTLLICAALAVVGAGALALIFNTEPEVQREGAVRETAMLVEVTRPERGRFRPMIEAMGTVTPAREVMLSPRVGGEIVSMAPTLTPGGFVREGEVLLTLDDSDYRNMLAQRESDLQRALAELEMEHGRQDMALEDYRELGKELPADKRALVLREPQLRTAEAAVKAARATVEQARLDLGRTQVRAPFDAQVLSRDVALGSQVGAGEPLARLAAIDSYWIEATIPLDKVRWLDLSVPDAAGDSGGAVEVRHRNAWAPGQQRQGRLLQLVGELEGDTRLARLLIGVDDPLALENPGAPRLIIGAFVECRIEGRELASVVRLPREFLRNDDVVWLERDGRLAIERVQVAFRDARYAYVEAGLDETDRVVTSNLATVKVGSALRTRSRETAAVTP